MVPYSLWNSLVSVQKRVECFALRSFHKTPQNPLKQDTDVNFYRQWEIVSENKDVGTETE